ncbi:hypothetical protein [Streptomyces luteireticuli]|uniref:hypothetical protein n=1 Tax=Streptomyces luteireticuli TaxID=173858 RepID=UPI003556519E
MGTGAGVGRIEFWGGLLSPLAAAMVLARRGERVLAVDGASQPSLAAGPGTGVYQPVLLDTPWPGPDPLATESRDN